MNEDKPRKIVYVEKHSEPSQLFDCDEVYYECPECHMHFDWSSRTRGGGARMFCSSCGNWLSWAKIDLDNYRETDRGFDKNMPLWKFLEEPRYGHTWEHDVSMTYSHSEKDILKGCLSLMQMMVDEFQQYCDFMDWRSDPDDEEQKFSVSIPYSTIVRRLFLWNTGHSGGISTNMKCRNLGITEHSITFEFDEEGELS